MRQKRAQHGKRDEFGFQLPGRGSIMYHVALRQEAQRRKERERQERVARIKERYEATA